MAVGGERPLLGARQSVRSRIVAANAKHNLAAAIVIGSLGVRATPSPTAVTPCADARAKRASMLIP